MRDNIERIRALDAEPLGVNPEGTGISRTVVIVGKDGRIIFRQPGAPAWALMSNALRGASDEAQKG